MYYIETWGIKRKKTLLINPLETGEILWKH
jgi:hypothetical protein